MISANVIKGIQELLAEQGMRVEPGETLGDMVARELNLSARESEILLERLHDGATVEEAAAAAGIHSAILPNETLSAIARAIGTVLGRLRQ